MASKTPRPRGAKPLTPEQEMGIEELIAEAERFFGSSSRKSTSSSGKPKSKSTSSDSDKSKSKTTTSSTKSSSSDSDKSKSKTTTSSDSDKSKSKTTTSSAKVKPSSSDSDKSKSKTTTSSAKVKPSSSDSDKPKSKTTTSSAKTKPSSSDSDKSKSKTTTSSAKVKSSSSDSDKSKSKTTTSSAKVESSSSDSDKSKAKTTTSSAKVKSKTPPRERVSVRSFSSLVHPEHEKQPPRIVTFFKRLPRWVLHLPLILLAVLIIWMSFEANMLQLKSAEVTVTDLPHAFRGTRVMYISDLHINSLNSVDKVNALIDEVMQLEPDLLLLGGDYTSSDPLMHLRATLSSSAAGVESDMRELFFAGLAQYDPPLGKYAVAGEEDNRLDSYANVCFLEAAMAKGGVTLLRNEAVRIEKDGETLVIAGVDDWETGEKELHLWADLVSARDCVILLCHDPESVPLLNSYPADDGFWIDLALCGHTHGGTVSIGSFEVFNFTSDRSRFSSGWHKENAAKVLISRGVGNDLLPLRLNAAPEVHLLTLN